MSNYKSYSSKLINVGSHSSFMFLIQGKLAKESYDYKIGTPCTWFFDDEDTKEFLDNESIELVSTASRYRANSFDFTADSGLLENKFYYSSPVDPQIEFMFIFKLNDINEKVVLPRLFFSCKPSKDSTTDILRTSLAMDNVNEKLIDNNSDNSVAIKPNDVIVIKKGADDYLYNKERVEASTDIELIPLNGDQESVIRKGRVELYYNTDETIYKFRIKKTAKEQRLEPTLVFMDDKTGRTSTLVLYNRVKEKTIDDYLPVYHYEDNDEQIAVVEPFSILYVSVSRSAQRVGPNKQPDYSYLDNIKEIEDSEVIDIIDVDSDGCDGEPGGCIVTKTYKYLIKNVQHEDELPKIKLYTDDPIGGQFEKALEITLKLKSTECALDDYPCCTKDDPKVLYQDDDGDWSVENGDWCIIKKQEIKTNDTSPRLIRTCEVGKLGYPCCDGLDNITDIRKVYFHYIGVQEDRECGLYTCVYTGDYPVCKTTTKVVYTDTEKWGVENNEWCVLCL